MKIRTGIAAAGIVLAGLIGSTASPASARSVSCGITRPMWNGDAGCARATWNEATGQFCWYHQYKSDGYGYVTTESKHTGQTQWRTTFADSILDANWSGGCAPARGKTGALPRPTAVRASVLQLDGRVIKIPFEIVLVG